MTTAAANNANCATIWRRYDATTKFCTTKNFCQMMKKIVCRRRATIVALLRNEIPNFGGTNRLNGRRSDRTLKRVTTISRSKHLCPLLWLPVNSTIPQLAQSAALVAVDKVAAEKTTAAPSTSTM
uniref:Uncharacterized protein n=1 Tax=Romanomermis culicivorax TaxID=13658 RepID=A0A915L938_ROMCU